MSAFRLASVFASLAVLATGFAVSHEEASPSSRNIRVTITIEETGNDAPEAVKTYEIMVRDRSKSALKTGWRVPIPSTTFNAQNASDGGPVPITSFTYQNVGLSARVAARMLGGDQIALEGNIEMSAIDAPSSPAAASGGRPTVGTFDHDFEVALADGAASEIVVVTKPDGRKLRLVLQADVER